MDLSTKIGNLKLKNPVIMASGTFGYGLDFKDYYDISILGAISVKGLHINRQEGNRPNRIMETPSGMMNAIGLQGIGVGDFRDKKMPELLKYDVPVIVNFWGKTFEEYKLALLQLNDIDGISAVELNVSCPNIKEGGISFGTDERILAELVSLMRKNTSYHIMVKLSPNVTSISRMARIVEDEGADSISLVNTFSAMLVDVEKRRPVLSNVVGGLSGPAIRPIAVRMVWEVARAVSIPVIGMGGIMTFSDALEFIIAGACAVQIGTANFVDPFVAIKVIEGISDYFSRHGIRSLDDIIGSLDIDF